MFSARCAVVAFLSLSGLVACASPRLLLMGPVPAYPRTARADIKAVTFNAGLAPGITRYAKQRAAAVAEELSRFDYDLLCVQEVWNEDDRQTVVSALNLPPENVYYVDTKGEGETGQDVCTPAELADILGCAKKKCVDEPPDETTTCAAKQCLEQGIWLYLHSRSCLNCLTASAGKSIEDIVGTCTSKTGASRSYGGNNGVILASRWPLMDKTNVGLPSSGANRVALTARVEVPGKGPVEVVCTHLSASNEVSPTNPVFSDWAEEQQAQVRLISERLALRAAGRPQVFMGDMNFGQRNEPIVSALMWTSWRLAADLGFVSPVEYAEPPFCTWCRSNRLTGAETDHLIDHVMFRNPSGGHGLVPVCSYRLFDKPIVILDWRGRKIVTNLSDHYGTAVELDLR